MESSTDQGLFQLSVNPSGKEWIRKFAQIVRWIIVLGILITLLQLGEGFVRLFYLQPLLKGNSLLAISSLAETYWGFGYLILFLIQLYLYQQISKNLLLAVDNNDEV